jgi:hypothetical protein
MYFFVRELSDGLVLVVALDDVEDRGERLAPIEHFAASDVACAEDGGDLVGGDHFSVLGGDFGAAEGNVEVGDDQRQLSHLFLFGHVDQANIIYL